jgi:hypothetical protein
VTRTLRDSAFFPPAPRLKGRATELATLVHRIETTAPARLALVGAGGSGKSVLAAALGHRLARRFQGRVHWFRVGAWDFRTLGEMLALRFGTSRERGRLIPELRARFAAYGEQLMILDNHEDDQAMARLLDALAETPATFVITARRCLLGGVLVFPVTAPLVTSGRHAFPRVARLTRLLRWNPLALDLADAIVASRAATVSGLASFLEERGVARVRVIDHEDDLPEVALLVDWAWPRLGAPSRRVLAVLAHVDGDHVDRASLRRLARAPDIAGALEDLVRWRLVQQPLPGRFALHAVVRHAVRKRSKGEPRRLFEHYVTLLERDPSRLVLEQTHLFGAMDHAHRASDLAGMLRIERLLAALDPPR